MRDWGIWTLVGWEDGNGWGGGGTNDKAGSKIERKKNKGGVLFYVFRYQKPYYGKTLAASPSGGAALQEEPSDKVTVSIFLKRLFLLPVSKRLCFFLFWK